MLIGAHVSPAGGPAKAVERGAALGARSIQIFNQNPRAWKPTVYSDEAVAAYHEAIAASEVDALLIHAVYLLNPASDDAEFRSKTLASLIGSLRAGDALGAAAVVLHPGSAKTGDPAAAIARAGEVIREALAESDRCPLHLENTAGAGGTLGRSFEELAALTEACRGDQRRGRHARPLVRGARGADRGLRRRRAHRAVPGLVPPPRLGLRHPHTAGADGGARRVRRQGGHGPAGVAARQRLQDPAGLQRRPPRRPGRRRARQAGVCRLPVRA